MRLRNPAHLPGVTDEMDHGDSQGHKGVEEYVAHRGGHVGELLDQRGVQRTPGGTDEQEAGHIGKTGIRYVDDRQVDVDPQGDDPHEQHGEDHDKGEDIT